MDLRCARLVDRPAKRVHPLGPARLRLVEQAPEVALKRDFAWLFGHCDRLLYEAKHNGRNRTMSERLQAFAERRRGFRRRSAASQAA